MFQSESPVAIYRQLAEHVRSQIVEGVFAPGTLLPTERDLMAKHDLSRVTVRLAMDILAKQGLIVRQRGKGTFVAARRIRNDLSIFSGFYDALTAQGLEIDVRILVFEARSRSPKQQLALPYESVLYIERLYSIDGLPIAVARAELHPRATSLQREKVEGRTNYQVLTSLLNFEIERAELAIQAKLAGEHTAQLLGLTVRDPIMELHRTTFSRANESIGWSIFSVPADRFEFGLSASHDREVVHSLRPAETDQFGRGSLPGSADEGPVGMSSLAYSVQSNRRSPLDAEG